MTDSMIERVARALFNVNVGNLERLNVAPWEYQEERDRDEYREMARAAIEAMRDNPTKAMEDAGNRYMGDVGSRHVFRAMIDAALLTSPRPATPAEDAPRRGKG